MSAKLIAGIILIIIIYICLINIQRNNYNQNINRYNKRSFSEYDEEFEEYDDEDQYINEYSWDEESYNG